jgi:pyridoxamine 5'-phosphate oxidase
VLDSFPVSEILDPISRFREVYERARVSPFDSTAVTLATADDEGRPSARLVLLKGFDERGFVFFTNRTSRKGDHLMVNPHAALCFYWPAINEQVRVEGSVEQVADAESDAYFASRPRESQIGAWCSRQSRPSPGRDVLEERYKEIEAKYAGQAIPRPRWWGGYRVVPERIEFWQQGPHRLHHRTLYSRASDGGWVSELLDP